MSSANRIQNIALIGAGGNVGSQILQYLLATNSSNQANFHITIVSRNDSKATFPDDNNPSVTIKRGAYDDESFLTSAFTGQDAAIFALGFMAMDHQKAMITAAVSAGVRWILPTEYAGDGANEGMVEKVPLFWPKREARQLISSLSQEKNAGKTKWIAVVTNPWVPFSLQTGMFGIDPYEKRATLYEDSGKLNVSTLPQVGKAVAALLVLPVKAEDGQGRRSLEHYADGFVYVSSALTTQREMFHAALKATGTKEDEWSVSRSSCQERRRVAQEAFAKGELLAGADGTYAVYMSEGLGGDYEAKAKEDREVLGLEVESVDEFVKQAVEMGPFRVM